MPYRIEARPDKVVIHCTKCESSSEDPTHVRLRSCPNCGYHTVFPVGVGGLASELPLGGGIFGSSLRGRPTVPAIGENSEE
jgi:hypothetical protein